MVRTYENIDSMPDLITVPEMAVYLRLSRGRAYEIVNEEGFVSLTVGRRILVPKNSFKTWLNNHTCTGNGNTIEIFA